MEVGQNNFEVKERA